jgi:hypothetical protein
MCNYDVFEKWEEILHKEALGNSPLSCCTCNRKIGLVREDETVQCDLCWAVIKAGLEKVWSHYSQVVLQLMYDELCIYQTTFGSSIQLEINIHNLGRYVIIEKAMSSAKDAMISLKES